MKKKKDNQQLLVVSEFFVEAKDFEIRYKALRKTVKSLKRFNEAQVKGKIAEA